MPARKKATSTAKKKSARARAAGVQTGPVPPYGEVIRGAVARGDIQAMKNLAASSRKWVADVQSALKQLETAVKKAEKK